jgi:hypothetical protein
LHVPQDLPGIADIEPLETIESIAKCEECAGWKQGAR